MCDHRAESHPLYNGYWIQDCRNSYIQCRYTCPKLVLKAESNICDFLSDSNKQNVRLRLAKLAQSQRT